MGLVLDKRTVYVSQRAIRGQFDKNNITTHIHMHQTRLHSCFIRCHSELFKGQTAVTTKDTASLLILHVGIQNQRQDKSWKNSLDITAPVITKNCTLSEVSVIQILKSTLCHPNDFGADAWIPHAVSCSFPSPINWCKNRWTRRTTRYVRSIKELKKLLGDGERSASGESRCLLRYIFSVDIPEKSPIQDGSQVTKSNFHLLVGELENSDANRRPSLWSYIKF